MGATVTAIKPNRRDPTRLAVFVDTEKIAVVPSELVHELGLEVGGELDAAARARLHEADRVSRAADAAMRSLARRPFARRELRTRLLQKGHAADAVDAGVGDDVIVAYGRAGRTALGRGHDIAVEAAVVAVVDDRTGEELV